MLNCPGIFHEDVNKIQSESSNKRAILSELHNLLLQEDVLQIVFSRFLVSFSIYLAYCKELFYFKFLTKVEFQVEIENVESRREIFAHNLVQIAEHNLDARSGRNTWYQAVNRFTYLVLPTHIGKRVFQ